MDEPGLRVEMTALFPNRRLAILVPLREQPRKCCVSRLERVTKSIGIGVAISPGTRSSEACKESLEHETE